MGRYAKETMVSCIASRAEIEQTLTRYGAVGFMYGWQAANAVIAFELNGRRIRFVLPMPDKDAEEFKRSPARRRLRGTEERLKAWEQACRQRWRALTLVIKAKLEAAETGITTFEAEFLAHIVLPGGRTYGDFALPQIDAVYRTKELPALFPWAGRRD